jgi:exodeoxyribonuclease VII large subunit
MTRIPPTARADRPPVLSVGELTDQLKDVLETTFPSVWVAGEISNLARPQSGHCYLTLKDDTAQLRAVIWRSTAARLRFELEDGLEVVCHGTIELYGPRGTYQLVIQQIHPKGMGALELALRKLREKLAAEGLFAAERKRPLPRFPRRIAVVTSPTGAAIRDFLEVLRRRWSGTYVLVVPVRVQGDGAAAEVAAAIAAVNRLSAPVDTLVVTRGGGSLEDLWAFNEEPVVRAIHASRVPVVSAIGHEIDVTLADLVADVRALTPSEAAELVVPDADEVRRALDQRHTRLAIALRRRAALARAALAALAGRRVLRKPLDRVREVSRRMDELEARGRRAVRRRAERARQEVHALGGRLASLNPLAVLDRGYSITERPDGQVVRDAAELAPHDVLVTRFAKGQATSRVAEVRAAAPHPDP